MTRWKSYHLLAESFSATDDNPASLLRWLVERVVHGLVDHDDYCLAIERAACRRHAMLRAERRMLQLMALDANPIAGLMRTAPDRAAFQRRWNGFNRMAPLGVETQVCHDTSFRLRRATRMPGLHEEMRDEAGAACIAHLLAGRTQVRQREDMAPLLAQHVGDLARDHLALQDSVHVLGVNPFAELGDCALAVGCSRRTLQRAFGHAGLSFRLLRQAVRLALAGDAIRAGGRSLTEIAHASGFFDSAHFAHAWKQSCGLTPLQYRSLC